MARIDKYEPLAGGTRAPLAAAWPAGDLSKVVGCGLDANGKVVRGAAGNSGFVGVVVLTQVKNAGDVVDIMTDGEIVEMTGLAAGTTYYLDAAGALTAVAPAAGVNAVRVGQTVEATRLVVRIERVQG